MAMHNDYVIPRNINVKETVAYGLSGKQIAYLVIGLGGAVAIWSITGIPLIGVTEKAVASLAVIVGSIGFSVAKVHGQNLDRYVVNSIKYPMRNKEFEGGVGVGGETNTKRPLVCSIRYNLA
jgi:hypothetical protein